MDTGADADMLQLAAEAFRAQNFDLAADIYECQLDELVDPGRRLELLVKRADALAFGGNLSEALGVYRQAAAINALRPPHLERLVELLTERVRGEERISTERVHRVEGGEAGLGCTGAPCDAFSCQMCLGFLFEPVTLACGHSFCKKCLEGHEDPSSCRECRANCSPAEGRVYRVNVVLNSLLTKWFPGMTRAAHLRREGNGLYSQRKMEAALQKYNEALLIAPSDHLLLSNRSQVLSSLRRYEEALDDAEMACRIQPTWAKAHLHRAQVLVCLGQVEEALREFLLCASMDSNCRLTRSEAHRLLGDILAPVPECVPDGLLAPRSQLKLDLLHITHDSAAWSSKTLGSTKSSSWVADSQCPGAPGSSEVRSKMEVASVLLKRKRSSTKEEEEERWEDRKRTKSDSCCSVSQQLIDPTDLECSLCMRLFYAPVTTPCGHSFCRQCLERCLDHRPTCPLCNEELAQLLAQRKFCATILLENFISRFLPSEFAERQKIHLEELAEFSNLNRKVPVFVCTVAFPTVPCPLHIFQPCYRLMVRRSLEAGSRCFGMCLAGELSGFADYGCILEIRNVEFFSDGRLLVDTIGRRRFKVLQQRETDGYNTADIEYLEDIKVQGAEEEELVCLHDAVYHQAVRWVDSLSSQQKLRIHTAFGPMPQKEPQIQASPDGPSWCWWLLAVLPLEGRAQMPFLALTSLRQRLRGIRRVMLLITHSRQRTLTLTPDPVT